MLNGYGSGARRTQATGGGAPLVPLMRYKMPSYHNPLLHNEMHTIGRPMRYKMPSLHNRLWSLVLSRI
jgi:hypothetical protein